MPTVRDIGEFLQREGLVSGPLPELTSEPVSVVRADDQAVGGALSWMSAKRLAQDPVRVQQFQGTLLIVPATGLSGAAGAGICIACRSPKLAFSRVVDRFFPELAAWPWPVAPSQRANDASVSPSAKIAPNVVIGAGCLVEDDVEIGPGTAIAHTTIRRGTRIGANCTIGLPGFGFDKSESGEWFRFPHIGTVEIGSDVEIGSNTCIDRGALGATRIGDGAKIDNLVHIAHNVVIGRNALVIANAMIGGSAHIGEGTWVAPSASVMNQVTVGKDVTVGMGAVVTKSVRDGVTVAGVPAKELQPKG